jgi:hypothetical protein
LALIGVRQALSSTLGEETAVKRIAVALSLVLTPSLAWGAISYNFDIFDSGGTSHGNSLSLTTAQVASGYSGYIEVFVTSTESPQPTLGDYQMRATVSTTPLSGMTFTSYAKTTTHSYIFTPAEEFFFSGLIDSADHRVIVSNASFTGTAVLADGVGLARIGYTIAAGTSTGTYTLAFPDSLTYMDDYDANRLTITPNSGTITITAVPEPGTYAAMIGLAVGGVPLAIWLRRRRARRVSPAACAQVPEAVPSAAPQPEMPPHRNPLLRHR